jgi:hypothetical protein
MKKTHTEFMLMLKTFINSVISKKLKRNFLFWLIIISSVHSSNTFANYQYIYTGNVFPTMFNALHDNPPYDLPWVSNEHIKVAFTTLTLLNAAANLTNVPAFNLYVVSDYGRSLAYPSPNPNPDFGWSDNGWPDISYVGNFNIATVDSYGLPTQWNISINYSYTLPTGHYHQSNIKTSTNKDITFGGYEGFFDYFGQLDNHQGTWSVTPVPEPETYEMLLAGLSTLGFIVCRRKNKET